jgi:hypothetical protein
MKKPSLEQKLNKTIEKLDASAQKIIATRGYSSEPAVLRMLSEILKEQLRNEDSRYSTRPVR